MKIPKHFVLFVNKSFNNNKKKFYEFCGGMPIVQLKMKYIYINKIELQCESSNF